MIPNVKKDIFRDVVLDNVQPGSVTSTDELVSYGLLSGDGYVHGAIKHGAKEYAYYAGRATRPPGRYPVPPLEQRTQLCCLA